MKSSAGNQTRPDLTRTMPQAAIDRPLSPSLPRDCGHECRACGITVLSLTDYASHISSPLHKQRVEIHDWQNAGNDQEEEYFDQKLVNLIEKRKELIRQEEEAAFKRAEEEAKQKKEEAKRKKDEEERRRKLQQLQQRWDETKQYVRQKGASRGWRQNNVPTAMQDVRGTCWQGSGDRNGVPGENSRSWHQQSRQGKSATWHAQDPPNFQNWASGERSGGSLHNRSNWGSKTWDHKVASGQLRGHSALVSNGDSANSVCKKGNSLQWQPTKDPAIEGSGSVQTMDFTSDQLPLSSLFNWKLLNFEDQNQQRREDLDGDQQRRKDMDGHQGGAQSREDVERERANGLGSKTFGSNPKLDKGCRWTPYPPTKLFDSATHADPNPKGALPLAREVDLKSRRDPALDSQPPRRQSRWDQRPDQKQISSRSSSSSSAQRDNHASCPAVPSRQRPAKPAAQRPEKRMSSPPGVNTQHSRASSQDSVQSRSSTQSGSHPNSLLKEDLLSEQEQQLSEMLRKAKETLLDRRGSLDRPAARFPGTTLHIDPAQGEMNRKQRREVEARKKRNSRQDRANPPAVPDAGATPMDNSSSIQSVHVSTSSVEASGKREDEEEGGSAAAGEAMQVVDAGLGSDSDVGRSSEAQIGSSSGSTAPGHNKLGLPPALKRDLTKHINAKSKTGTHEPNLNIARRIRNVSEVRKGESEKDSGLKPTVRQLISSSGSRRNVNWEQVYQEIGKKKQEQSKGKPRFGIEMVSCDQEGLSQEEDDIPLNEGFHWESLLSAHAAVAPPPPRKRCLSESSIAPESSMFTSQGPTGTTARKSSIRPVRCSSPTPIHTLSITLTSTQNTNLTPGYEAPVKQEPEEATDRQSEPRSKTEAQGPEGTLQPPDSVVGDSSGTELNEVPGSGKKRRAAGDIPSPEIPSLERKNKRRKTKSKKDRLQVDQLLTVSLKEEELSRDLQTVDHSLVQARAALQAAYMEVQRLLVVKQQVTMEMSTLRSKRIELLQGIQGDFDSASPPVVKDMDQEMAVAPAGPHIPELLSPTTDAVVIKQEPLSPDRGATLPDPEESMVLLGAHSTTPEPTLTASLTDAVLTSKFIACRRLSGGVGGQSDRRDSLSGCSVIQTEERSLQGGSHSYPLSPSDAKPCSGLPPASRRGSQAGSLEPAASLSDKPLPAHPLPHSPAEMRTGKRVRKLKKKRVLRKAQGTEQLENSDSEAEGETSSGCSRPQRKLRTRRRSSSGRAEEAAGPQSPATKPGQEDSDSPLEMVELPQTAPTLVTIDLSDLEDGCMEVTLASPQPQPPASALASAPDPAPASALDPAFSTQPSEPQKLACNEVSSTSEMEVSTVDTTCDRDTKLPTPISLKVFKTSSADVSSDGGEAEPPSEGVFEGHQEAVNCMQVHNGLLYTGSGDRTVRAFNLVTRKCVAVFEGHSTKVNCVVVSSGPGLPQRLYSGSSDQTIRCYSLKTKECVQQFSLSDRVLCLLCKWKVLYAGLANGSVVSFSLKTNQQLDVFECHGPRAVSCLATAQEGARRILLVGSYDSTISVRDAKSGLMLRTLEGHTKTVLCMKVVNDLVFSGSSDQSVHAHNIHTGQLMRVYQGHHHAVTVVSVLGKVMVTACLDKLVRVFELQSQDCLQVYGGHSDMVMCMVIHKSMIYTGCYDGSVQAVKLNLMQNHRCQWLGCPLVFGLQEHLQHHLLQDHASHTFHTLKCRWRNCDEVFSSRSSSKQGVPRHMMRHIEEGQLEA